MPTYLRSLLAAAAAVGVASIASIAPAQTGDVSLMDQTVADLVRRSSEAHAALMRGDVDAYQDLITLSQDFTFYSPFGGPPTRGIDMTEETWNGMRRFFRNGTLRQELVQAYASDDLVVLAIIEYNNGEVGGLPAQDWPLRVTLVYRRENGEWRLAHRHADPLVNGVTLEEAAALAR